jgi:hypothetical protein
MSGRGARGWAIVCTAVLASSCDGGAAAEPDPMPVVVMCPAAQPCGGDLVGTWTIMSLCLSSDSGSTAACPTESDDARGLVLTGTMTFGADSSFTTTDTLSGTVVRSIPLSCARGAGAGSCAQVEALIGSASYRSVRCTGASTCTCTIDLVPTTASSTGTYVKATNLVTISQSDGSVETDSYCVSGDTLTLVKHSDPTSGILTLSRAQ